MPDKAIQEKTSTIKSESAFENHQDMSYSAPVQRQPAEQQIPVETRMLEVYEGKVKLEYPHMEPGHNAVTTEYSLQPDNLALQDGMTVTPGALGAQVSVYGDQMDPASQGVVFTALGGQVELALSNFGQAKGTAELATMNIVSSGTSDSSETEISAYLREPLVVELMPNLSIELGQGEYIKHKDDLNPVLKFWQTRLIFDSQSMGEDFQTELDETGLHLTQEQDVQVDEQKPGGKEASEVVDTLKRRVVPEFEEPQEVKEQIQEEQPQAKPVLVAENKESEKSEKLEKLEKEASDDEDSAEVVGEFEEPHSVTKDEFVSLKNIEYKEEQYVDERSDRLKGKAQFEFEEIPFRIIRPNGKEYSGHTQTKSIGDELMDFEFEDDGRLYVTFNDPIELQVFPDGVTHLIFKLILEDAEISGSRLVAKKIRLDVGAASKGKKDDDDDEDEDAESLVKKMFGADISATMAMVNPESELDDRGIHIVEGGKTLGAFAVSDFLGFLSVEGDYPKGSLKVLLEKKAEQEAGKTKLLSETARDFFDNGLNIPLVGPLSFVFSISPKVSINGSLEAEANRGGSFAKRLEPGENLDLSGKMSIGAKGELGMSAGLALSVPTVIASVASIDLKVNTNMAAAITAEAEAGTRLGITDAKKPRLQQTDDLNMHGQVKVDLSGVIGMSSDVKFLVWKAQIFKVELAKKEWKLTPYEGKASRSKDAQGVLNGWNFEPMALSATAFGKKTLRDLNRVGVDQEKAQQLEMSKAAAESIGKDVEEAWTTLEQLKEQRSGGYVYAVDEEDQAALDQRIKTMTAELKTKIENYYLALEQYQKDLDAKEKDLKEQMETAREKQFQYMKTVDVKQQAMKDTQAGGFDLANYAPLKAEEHPNMQPKEIEKKNKQRRRQATIDFAIARVLGMFDNKLAQYKDEYNVLARERNMILEDRWSRGETTSEKRYRMADEKMSDQDFLETELQIWGFTSEQFRADTRMDQFSIYSYYDVLMEKVPIKKANAIFEPLFYKKKEENGDEIAENKENKKNNIEEREYVRKYDLMRTLLTGRYPKGSYDAKGNLREGETFTLDAKDKSKIFVKLFSDTLSPIQEMKQKNGFYRNEDGKALKGFTARKAMKQESSSFFHQLFKLDIDEMIKMGDIDIGEALGKLDVELQTAKEEYLSKVEEHLQARRACENVEAKKEEWKNKLTLLNTNVESGMRLGTNAPARAADAVNFVDNEYGKIASGKTMLEAAAVNIDHQSAAYKELRDRAKNEFQKKEALPSAVAW